MIFVFHGLFLDRAEIKRNLIDPQQGVTVDDLRCFVKYFLDRKYTFVSPKDILKELDPAQNHVMITFDDGYYNNTRALPVLREYKIPAVFFITTNNVRDNACFWWDVVYRENLKRGTGVKQIGAEDRLLKKGTAMEIEQYLIARFGRKSFQPLGDTDRPFTPGELKEFSKEEFVHLGNHTSDHAILTSYTAGQIHTQIWEAQSYLHQITGAWPEIISYPNGNFSTEVLQVAKELNLPLGVTLEEKRNPLPLTPAATQKMGRFFLLGSRDIHQQLDILTANLTLHLRLKTLLKPLL
jgi:peptidoglycan/xylan/chitin deacetylase (PgdA/CDA1 family)